MSVSKVTRIMQKPWGAGTKFVLLTAFYFSIWRHRSSFIMKRRWRHYFCRFKTKGSVFRSCRWCFVKQPEQRRRKKSWCSLQKYRGQRPAHSNPDYVEIHDSHFKNILKADMVLVTFYFNHFASTAAAKAPIFTLLAIFKAIFFEWNKGQNKGRALFLLLVNLAKGWRQAIFEVVSIIWQMRVSWGVDASYESGRVSKPRSKSYVVVDISDVLVGDVNYVSTWRFFVFWLSCKVCCWLLFHVNVIYRQ